MNAAPGTYWPQLIKAIRLREGLSQRALAAQLSVDQTSVSRWERAADEPSLKFRRRLREMARSNFAARQDRALLLRVACAWAPTTLMAKGALFLELNEAAAAEVGVARQDLRGRSLYGAFGSATDEVTASWERQGLFNGDIAMSASVNCLSRRGAEVHIRTLDTPYFTSDGEVWCLTEVTRIEEIQYHALRREWNGSTLTLPFE